MVARYKCLTETFIAPFLIAKGSVIETTSAPGPHLLPLNKEAEDAFERWYEEEHPELNKSGEPTGRMVKPHAKHRTVKYEKADAATVRLVAAPPKDSLEGTFDLGTAMLMQPSQQLVPEPDPIYKQAEAEFESKVEGTTIVEARAARVSTPSKAA